MNGYTNNAVFVLISQNDEIFTLGNSNSGGRVNITTTIEAEDGSTETFNLLPHGFDSIPQRSNVISKEKYQSLIPNKNIKVIAKSLILITWCIQIIYVHTMSYIERYKISTMRKRNIRIFY